MFQKICEDIVEGHNTRQKCGIGTECGIVEFRFLATEKLKKWKDTSKTLDSVSLI